MTYGTQRSANQETILTFNTAVKFTRKYPLELVIFCGSPGSGKSTYFWNNLEPLGYERINQDILKTVGPTPSIRSPPSDKSKRPKCLKVARELLEAKKSVAVGESRSPTLSVGYQFFDALIDQPQIIQTQTSRLENTGRH